MALRRVFSLEIQNAPKDNPVTELKGHHREKAAEALALLEARADRILVHFDVDVIDSAEFPLADWPHYQGLTLKEAALKLGLLTEKQFADWIKPEAMTKPGL